MVKKGPCPQFYRFLETFLPPIQDYLKKIPQTSGMLTAENCLSVMEALHISADDLMLRLLPAAKLYAATGISDFQVGAVAKARISRDSSEFALYLGANIEFPDQALIQTIHAEQAAIMNAWLQGAVQVDAVAVTAAPCGCCRQFLYELEGNNNLTVVIQKPDGRGVVKRNLADLLPEAFGPHELGSATGLMASSDLLPNLILQSLSNDPFVLEALAAAARSYAPYTHNFAGCAIQASDGKTYTGRYAENAAFNPSLSPLHTAIIRLNMDRLGTDKVITRAVLVERPTSSRQRDVCEILLQAMAPDVRLEYFEADSSYC
jgi:cytidine deaminase